MQAILAKIANRFCDEIGENSLVFAQNSAKYAKNGRCFFLSKTLRFLNILIINVLQECAKRGVFENFLSLVLNIKVMQELL